MSQKHTIPFGQLAATLKQYRAELHRDVSTEKAHIYYSRPMGKWIAVLRKGENAILSFHNDCPCSKVLNGQVP